MRPKAKPFPGRDDLWLDDGVVVRRHDRTSPATIEWIHRVLEGVAATAFPAPRPVPYFEGASVATIDGAVCSAVTFLPGEIVGWADAPDMFRMGAYLAEFHAAAVTVEGATQQSPAYSVDTLPDLADAL